MLAQASIAASPWLALAALVPLLIAAGGDAARRAWAWLAVATLALFLAVRALPQLLPGARALGDQWDWSGPLLALVAVLLLAARLVRLRQLAWHEAGITLRHTPGALQPALTVSAALLAAHYVAMSFSSFRLPGVPLETWLYQASVPGLVEETVFRGLLLALADRAWPPRWTVAGARIGAGGLLVTLSFLALHGVTLGTLLGVLPAALLYLWLRARTGSLLLPIVMHNLWNLSVYAAHL
jgi:hypothetical protein